MDDLINEEKLAILCQYKVEKFLIKSLNREINKCFK